MPPRISQSTASKLRLRLALFGGTRSLHLRSQTAGIRHGHAIRPLLRRKQHLTTDASTSLPTDATKARSELKNALLKLQKVAGGYVPISPTQLALRGLDQNPGQETIRIAVFGSGRYGSIIEKTKELVRILVADPLTDEEEWERQLVCAAAAAASSRQPILLKIGPSEAELHVSSNRLVNEIYVSSPLLNSHHLEILVFQSDVLENAVVDDAQGIADSMLVPTVEVPTSATGRYTPVTTPVHKAIILGSGLSGVASLARFPAASDAHPNILSAVDIPGYLQASPEELPFQVIDISLAAAALASFRRSVDNAQEYEREWFQSGVPVLLDFIKQGTAVNEHGHLKKPLSSLIATITSSTELQITQAESQHLHATTSSRVPIPTILGLKNDLKEWSQRAHTELRDTLEAAFAGPRWRKLNWYKLFWRVDDVSMISSDMLQQRFLPEAEKEIVYLAGKIDQAGIAENIAVIEAQQQQQQQQLDAAIPNSWAYKTPEPEQRIVAMGTLAPETTYADILPASTSTTTSTSFSLPAILKPQPWPLHIPLTRHHLLTTKIPELQSLSQRLLFQTLSTSTLASAFSALIYLNDMSTTLYEAGAVGALGIVWSLRRLQRRWEEARSGWEEECREEGRRVIGRVEGSVENVLRLPAEGAELGVSGEAAESVESRQFVEAREAVDDVKRFLARITQDQEKTS